MTNQGHEQFSRASEEKSAISFICLWQKNGVPARRTHIYKHIFECVHVSVE